jgi:hypothetical protein
MIKRTASGRPSRKKVPVNWSAVLDEIETGRRVEVPKPPHLSIVRTLHRIQELAAQRKLPIDWWIICGHLDVWRK